MDFFSFSLFFSLFSIYSFFFFIVWAYRLSLARGAGITWIYTRIGDAAPPGLCPVTRVCHLLWEGVGGGGMQIRDSCQGNPVGSCLVSRCYIRLGRLLRIDVINGVQQDIASLTSVSKCALAFVFIKIHGNYLRLNIWVVKSVCSKKARKCELITNLT